MGILLCSFIRYSPQLTVSREVGVLHSAIKTKAVRGMVPLIITVLKELLVRLLLFLVLAIDSW